MDTYRHSLDLLCGRNRKLVIAPRCFAVGDRIIYVHIVDGYCTFVQLFDHLEYINKGFARVAIANLLKLHCCTKGLYFNYSYWISEEKKKTIRVYICE